MQSQDTEITLGLGKLLGLFLVLAILCGVFFSIGYSFGKSSAKGAATTADASLASEPSGPKPAGSVSAKSAQPENKPDLTFYKAVGQKEPDANLQKPEPEPEVTPAPARAADPMTPKSVAPEIARPGSGYVVQVAAVSKQEDAQALADALRKKSYAVLIATNPPNDKLYHVQVGPFVDIATAEDMRTRLVSDGYNPILKK
ncbi:Sporulation related protein [Candidatus Koribacter versatilis Ellin345]|uniref:Sporulation related protein n=1 Tax=Koribacter versatilis (strain Ellin345) TaxID=204669 RepID=Q1INL8_KORVE|nr:SPOR domain-containing protein [Candidatus Koribacter versatilis]ABF41532.1 Sporulation related protein [Candidatus Koribacter versatilis Ellin345]